MIDESKYSAHHSGGAFNRRISALVLRAFIAPQGEIHESLLVGFGEVATFAGALFGIDYTYKWKSKHGYHPPEES